LLAEATPCLNARGHRFGERDGNAGFVTSEDLLAAVVTPIGNSFEFVNVEACLCWASDVVELRSIRSFIRYRMRDDQVMFSVNRDLNIISDDSGASAAHRHRAAI